jgi:DNA-binding LacI/PurR family transcriptional regulator
MPVGNFVSAVPLTTVSQPITEIAETVVDLFLKRLTGNESATQSIKVRGELVLRESTSPP